jgi:hypothetical protein
VERETDRPVIKTDKGAKYGIPDSSCRRINDGALRADHNRLFETARMVTANCNKEVINMNTISKPVSREAKHAHDEIAALLSIVPGLGHIYKGHYEAGFLWMFLGMPFAIWIGILFGLATAGIGLLFPILCWAGLAWDAYNEKDRRHHHLTATWPDDDELQD